MAENYRYQCYLDILTEVIPSLGTSGNVTSEEVPSLEHVVIMSETRWPGVMGFSNLMKSRGGMNGVSEACKKVKAEDACVIQFTSVSHESHHIYALIAL